MGQGFFKSRILEMLQIKRAVVIVLTCETELVLINGILYKQSNFLPEKIHLNEIKFT